jgi:hypothetical protein
MLLFCLIPDASRLDDPDWSASVHNGPCYVVATDARRARLYAAGAFADAGAERTVGGLRPASPWMRPDLVAVDRTIGPGAAIGVEGTILVPVNQPEQPHRSKRGRRKPC